MIDVKDILNHPGPTRGHMTYGRLCLYLRRTRRFIGREPVEAVDVASIEADIPGQGEGTKFFEFLEGEARDLGLCIFVESITNPRFAAWLLRRGYSEEVCYPQCLYLLPSPRQ